MIYKEDVVFSASKEQVWDLLTNPAKTKQYMFGCEILSDWNIGDEVLWKGKTEDGSDIVYVQGHLLEYEKGKKVRLTMFDPNMGIADIPENYVKLTYDINVNEKGTILTIIQDFTGVENAQKRFDETAKGWEMIIPLMKQIVN